VDDGLLEAQRRGRHTRKKKNSCRRLRESHALTMVVDIEKITHNILDN
jgi:hypothetical protein